MTDVSIAIDLLLEGVVPERLDELKSTWGNEVDRVRLQDGPGFLVQQAYGVIQVNEMALKQIWFMGYAAQEAIDAYSGIVFLLGLVGAPFDLAVVNSLHGQAVADAAFVERMRQFENLLNVAVLEDFDWPADVPFPQTGIKIPDPIQKATFDLVCMAGGYIFLHEIRHALLWKHGSAPPDILDEERECDRYALEIMVGRAADYASSSGSSASLVLAKRLLGCVFAQLVILKITPRKGWSSAQNHPAVSDRIRCVLEARPERPPYRFDRQGRIAMARHSVVTSSSIAPDASGCAIPLLSWQ